MYVHKSVKAKKAVKYTSKTVIEIHIICDIPESLIHKPLLLLLIS